ncbi:GNAT family N-acetyltransferase [[Limnothrix rosea] IAM M-220]|uniref:GNAT family N-acetyltransferase n=1 Tax=[Limnothrix rosea] IAM M-220 TaxID=454133 RepID=UPI0009638180|nr:GNAT family N-acetyltransferase [[Limnothrix rosea] IAM M-220]OKH14227.1 hypothetical protein NIES208_14030 [[Limnothrix rosea] IAM M-220]
MNIDVTLRNYQDEDFPALQQLLIDTQIFYEPLDKQVIFQRKINHDAESIIVAEQDRHIIGTIFFVYDPWNSFIFRLGVHPDHQGQGLANRLMDEAEKRLRNRGMPRPTLFVEEDKEEVLTFYKKRGWEVLYKVFCLEKDLQQ